MQHLYDDGGADEAVPLSYAQRRLWFLDRLDGPSATYNIPLALRLDGELDPAALAAALADVVARHESLRTLFRDRDGQPYQHILPPDAAAIALERRDIAAAGLDDALLQDAVRPFDLEHALPLRATLYRLAADRHVLLLVLHHIAGDGWSIVPLADDLGAAYGARRDGRAPAWAPLPVQYADYTLWQRELLGDPADPASRMAEQLGYWRQALAGLPELTALPLDRPRPAVAGHQGDSLRFPLDPALYQGLQALARAHRVTLFMLLQAALATLLARLGGGDDIALGSPIAGRTDDSLHALVGYFANTLVLRTDTGGDPTFAQLLARVRAGNLAAYRHQDLPFDRLVEQLSPARSLAHHPLFQVMLVLQNNVEAGFSLPGLQAEPLPLLLPIAKFDLTFNLFERRRSGQLDCIVEYATELFDRAGVERIAGRLVRLLHAVAAAPQTRLSALPLLDPAERALIVDGWNDTATVYPADGAIHRLFERQARQHPDRVALVFEHRRLSYGELNARANRLAHWLAARGAGPDARVALCLERSVEMVVALLAVLKAGGAYVPLDPDQPAERRAGMLADAAAVVLLTQRHLQAGCPAAPAVFCLDDDDAAAALAAQPDHDPAPALRPGNLAYVIYTSGSTGRPKGVGVDHAGILNRLQWMQAAYRLDADDRVLQKTPYGFDVSVWEFFWPLAYGARLVLARPGGQQEPAYLAGLMAEQAITTVHFVPPMLEVFLASVEPEACRSLRRVVCSGQALPPELQRRFFAALPGVALHNLYGPTEASVDVTAWTCRADAGLACVPIGRPIANIRIHILDAHLNPVPAGVAGELHIAGVGLARGYLGRPDLTAAAFIPDPFGAEPGARMYRSGDLARYLADGSIEYLGRLDHQLKLRGFRIEPGEIEAALAALPAVREALVMTHGNVGGGDVGGGDAGLVAYLVPADAADAVPPAAELRRLLAQRLPDYMVPAHFIVLERLPLTPNGKVDRKALPAPGRQGGQDDLAPRDATEAMLAQIWRELLGLERVGVRDDFFALGGHSLLAVAVVERLRRAGLAAEVRTLFAHPTIEGLAAALGAGFAAAAVPPNRIPADAQAITPDMLPLVALTAEAIAAIVAAVPGGAANVQDIYPLAPLQEGLLFHHLREREGDAYLTTLQFAFADRERLDRFAAALQAVIDRHDILRTVVVWQSLDQPVQVVLRRAALRIEEVEADGDVAAELRARYDPARYRLDIGQAPMIRGFAARDAAGGRWLLHLLQHHLIDDNLSLQRMFAELRRILAGEARLLPAALPFRHFIAQARQGVDAAEHEAFFNAMLGRVDATTAPFGVAALPAGGALDQVRRPLPAELVERLRRQARTCRVGTASLLHLAWALVLARLTGRGEVVFGTVLFGRLQGGQGAAQVMGPCINTLPICLRVDGVGLRDGLRRTHALLAQLLRHEHAPLSLAQRCSGVAAPQPLFASLLNCRRGEGEFGADLMDGGALIHAEERTDLPFVVSVDELPDAMVLAVQAGAGIAAQRLYDSMQAALAALAQGLEQTPERPVRALDILPAGERAQLLAGWNATARPYPREATLAELFEAQVARTPGLLAVVAADGQLSYRQLDARANRLAHALRRRGVGPDVLVGLSLPPSLDLAVALLAILKAGGAYLPLDPELPDQRLAYLLDDAAPALILRRSGQAALLEGITVLALDRLEAELACCPTDPPPLTTRADHLAYVMYTSGSTGQPKGVQVTQRNVSRLVCNSDYFALGPGQRVLHLAPLAFDASTFEIWAPLLNGATLVLPPPGSRSLERIGELITGIDTLWLTAALFNQLVEHQLPQLATVGHLLAGGEALSVPHVRKFLAAGGKLSNGYGPTECTTFSCVHPLPLGAGFGAAAPDAAAPDATAPGTSVPIGRPIANGQAYILDDRFEPAPVEVAGELYIAGDGLARGYLNRPDLTAERFLPCPFGQPGARMYRTGDLARYLPNGEIEYLGRIDRQVKIRGLRIEPGEIEAALLAQGEISEAAVLAREDEPGDKRLVAYLVPQPGRQVPAAAELRSRLQQTLPDYMVPAHYVSLDALPLTANGKLDRNALPAPQRRRGEAGYVAPRNETEAVLARMWAEVLKLERVGVHDDFFALGGHSLLATRIMSRSRRELGVELPLEALFERATVAGLAQRYDEMKSLLEPCAEPGADGPAEDIEEVEY
ncbi:non-ribosomal peptide synthetase [Chitinimonas koreensis]|uniref:non-ribosomal peptide synthetase n=1 Tax=Chitinimonas koreensis TaxID=356302 RepID=UPI00041FFE0B|nr:non-ribosomal peptide synthetase [Chitinimonas koreensis]